MGKMHDKLKMRKLIKEIAPQAVEKPKVKGEYGGLCNITSCQSPNGVVYYNRYTSAFYCKHCAKTLNKINSRNMSIDQGAPFVLFKTPEEATKCYVKKQ